LLQEIANSAEMLATRHDVTVDVDAPPYIMVVADKQRMGEAFQRLLAAAIAGTPPGGEVVMAAYADDEGVEVEIAEGGADMIDSPESIDANAAMEERLAEIRGLLSSEGIELQTSQCADGGTAYTVYFASPGETPDQESQKAA
jgi:hypothetical protein